MTITDDTYLLSLRLKAKGMRQGYRDDALATQTLFVFLEHACFADHWVGIWKDPTEP